MKTKRILTVVGVVAGVCLLAAILFMSASRAATAVQDGCFPVHQVQADETAESIAQIYGITVDDLLMANELASAEDIYAGQELCIPTGEPETSVVTETLTIEAAPATTETLTIEAAPATTETLTIEAMPTITETLGVEATPATTETLTMEAPPATTESPGVRPPEGITTRFSLRGQVVDEDEQGIERVTVTAQLDQNPSKSAKTNEHGYFSFTDLQRGSWIFRVAVPDSQVDKDQVDKAQADKVQVDKVQVDKVDKAQADKAKADKVQVDKADKAKAGKVQVDKADKAKAGKVQADKDDDKDDKDKDDKDKDDKDKDDKPDKCRAYHTVHRGDQLSRIAEDHDSSIRAIARANGIRNPDKIYRGQKLCIP